MGLGWAIAIIAVVLGVIVGNILLLKQTSKFKLPETSKDNNSNWDEEDN